MIKILLIKHGSLGDVISSTSVLNDIRSHYEHDQLFLLTTDRFKSFFLKSPFTNKLIIDNREGIIRTILLLNKIIQLKFDLIIDLQNSSRTSIYALFLRLFSSSQINGTGFFSTQRYINNLSNLPSVIDGLSNQIEILNIKTSRKTHLDWLMMDKFDWGIIKTNKFFIINPGCSLKNTQKKWPEYKYAKICNFLIANNILPVLIGSIDDEESINKIITESSGSLNLCNLSPLSVIFQISKKALGALSNDTGPGHLIAASGCKIHLILSSFSNINTVIPRGTNVTLTQKKNINDISTNEIIKKIKKDLKI